MGRYQLYKTIIGYIAIGEIAPICKSYMAPVLRMYCIDRAGVPESHDAHAFYCLYDRCILAKVP